MSVAPGARPGPRCAGPHRRGGRRPAVDPDRAAVAAALPGPRHPARRGRARYPVRRPAAGAVRGLRRPRADPRRGRADDAVGVDQGLTGTGLGTGHRRHLRLVPRHRDWARGCCWTWTCVTSHAARRRRGQHRLRRRVLGAAVGPPAAAAGGRPGGGVRVQRRARRPGGHRPDGVLDRAGRAPVVGGGPARRRRARRRRCGRAWPWAGWGRWCSAGSRPPRPGPSRSP